MAAWLAYLKSRLLLPDPEPDPDADEPSAEAMAEALALQLRRLEAMQWAAGQLDGLPRLGREVFARGAPSDLDDPVIIRDVEAGLIDLLRAYGDIRSRVEASILSIRMDDLVPLETAVDRLRTLAPELKDWQPLNRCLPPVDDRPLVRRSALASTFFASLALAKEGIIQLRQERPLEDLEIRGTEPRLS